MQCRKDEGKELPVAFHDGSDLSSKGQINVPTREGCCYVHAFCPGFGPMVISVDGKTGHPNLNSHDLRTH